MKGGDESAIYDSAAATVASDAGAGNGDDDDNDDRSSPSHSRSRSRSRTISRNRNRRASLTATNNTITTTAVTTGLNYKRYEKLQELKETMMRRNNNKHHRGITDSSNVPGGGILPLSLPFLPPSFFHRKTTEKEEKMGIDLLSDPEESRDLTAITKSNSNGNGYSNGSSSKAPASATTSASTTAGVAGGASRRENRVIAALEGKRGRNDLRLDAMGSVNSGQRDHSRSRSNSGSDGDGDDNSREDRDSKENSDSDIDGDRDSHSCSTSSHSSNSDSDIGRSGSSLLKYRASNGTSRVAGNEGRAVTKAGGNKSLRLIQAHRLFVIFVSKSIDQ
jgi:hypothetical protein